MSTAPNNKRVASQQPEPAAKPAQKKARVSNGNETVNADARKGRNVQYPPSKPSPWGSLKHSRGDSDDSVQEHADIGDCSFAPGNVALKAPPKMKAALPKPGRSAQNTQDEDGENAEEDHSGVSVVPSLDEDMADEDEDEDEDEDDGGVQLPVPGPVLGDDVEVVPQWEVDIVMAGGLVDLDSDDLLTDFTKQARVLRAGPDETDQFIRPAGELSRLDDEDRDDGNGDDDDDDDDHVDIDVEDADTDYEEGDADAEDDVDEDEDFVDNEEGDLEDILDEVRESEGEDGGDEEEEDNAEAAASTALSSGGRDLPTALSSGGDEATAPSRGGGEAANDGNGSNRNTLELPGGRKAVAAKKVAGRRRTEKANPPWWRPGYFDEVDGFTIGSNTKRPRVDAQRVEQWNSGFRGMIARRVEQAKNGTPRRDMTQGMRRSLVRLGTENIWRMIDQWTPDYNRDATADNKLSLKRWKALPKPSLEQLKTRGIYGTMQVNNRAPEVIVDAYVGQGVSPKGVGRRWSDYRKAKAKGNAGNMVGEGQPQDSNGDWNDHPAHVKELMRKTRTVHLRLLTSTPDHCPSGYLHVIEGLWADWLQTLNSTWVPPEGHRFATVGAIESSREAVAEERQNPDYRGLNFAHPFNQSVGSNSKKAMCRQLNGVCPCCNHASKSVGFSHWRVSVDIDFPLEHMPVLCARCSGKWLKEADHSREAAQRFCDELYRTPFDAAHGTTIKNGKLDKMKELNGVCSCCKRGGLLTKTQIAVSRLSVSIGFPLADRAPVFCKGCVKRWNEQTDKSQDSAELFLQNADTGKIYTKGKKKIGEEIKSICPCCKSKRATDSGYYSRWKLPGEIAFPLTRIKILCRQCSEAWEREADKSKESAEQFLQHEGKPPSGKKRRPKTGKTKIGRECDAICPCCETKRPEGTQFSSWKLPDQIDFPLDPDRIRILCSWCVSRWAKEKDKSIESARRFVKRRKANPSAWRE